MPTKLILTAILTVSSAAFAQTNSGVPAQDRSIASLVRAESANTVQAQVTDSTRRSWKLSLIPLIASQTLDVTSSYGLRELNPLLASSNGQFGAKAAGIKIGATAGIVALEYLIVKAHPGARNIFSKLNWSGAVVTSAFAVHNYSIR